MNVSKGKSASSASRKESACTGHRGGHTRGVRGSARFQDILQGEVGEQSFLLLARPSGCRGLRGVDWRRLLVSKGAEVGSLGDLPACQPSSNNECTS